MSILIIALPRTGSTSLGQKLALDNKLTFEFEPFNPLARLRYNDSYKKKVVKTMVFHTPFFISENERLDWLIEISKDFKEVILLSRKNLIDCTESWSFLLHNTKKGFRSNLPYLWEKTPNYDEQLDFIKKCDEELKYISEKINTPIKFYEDLYDLNDVNRLRKGDRDNTEKNKLL
jgi:hypothetical protein